MGRDHMGRGPAGMAGSAGNENEILVGELTNWRVQKLLLKAPTNSTK